MPKGDSGQLGLGDSNDRNTPGAGLANGLAHRSLATVGQFGCFEYGRKIL
ncbi:MAG: hypothetical protein K0U66_02565 [Gammaproteobacteria bacterium]|nr:hypothetical protein [Gammaproteobacteria bacterium]